MFCYARKGFLESITNSKTLFNTMHDNETTTEVNLKYDQVTYKSKFAICGLHQLDRTPATKFLKDFNTIPIYGLAHLNSELATKFLKVL